MRKQWNLQLGVAVVVALVGVSASALAATADAISPNKGPTGGGQLVRVYCSGMTFDPVTLTNNSVTIDGIAATVTAASTANQTIDATTGIGVPVAGANKVVVTDNAANTGTSAAGLYVYISRNTTLVVNVQATIAQIAQIAWGNGTSNDDGAPSVAHAADTIAPFTWKVQDGQFAAIPAQAGRIDIATAYRSDDATNSKTIIIENLSPTGTACHINATAVGTPIAPALVPVFPVVAPGVTFVQDTVVIKGKLGAGAMVSLDAGPDLTTAAGASLIAAPPGAGNDQALVLEFDSPPSVSAANVATLATFSVTMAASVP